VPGIELHQQKEVLKWKTKEGKEKKGGAGGEGK